jgi:cell division protein FtsB
MQISQINPRNKENDVRRKKGIKFAKIVLRFVFGMHNV